MTLKKKPPEGMNLYDIVYTINDGSGRGIKEKIYAMTITKAMQLSKFNKTFHIDMVCKRKHSATYDKEELISSIEFKDRDLMI